MVDASARQVRAYDAGNHLIVAYPATIGSPENPAPSGEHVVRAVIRDPAYVYDPANSGAGGTPLKLAPGPNNPLGSVMIDLTDPGYAIHGTADPNHVGKPGAYGCVGLANWDVDELARLIAPGVVVSFVQ